MSVAGMTEAQLMQAMIHGALSSPAPRLHANAVGLAVAGSDVLITLWANGQPVGVLNVSFTTAKSIAIDLSNLLKEIETAVGHQISTPKEVQEGIERVRRSQASDAPAAST
jgi:hypothetical protein